MSAGKSPPPIRQNRVLLEAARLLLKAYGKKNTDSFQAMQRVEKAIQREQMPKPSKARNGH